MVMEEIAKRFDLPPVWLLGGLALVFALSWLENLTGFPLGFGIYGPGLGVACLVLGFWLIASAIWLMRLNKTTLHPRGRPGVLVTNGVFGLSRNPIYLGFVMELLAASYWSDAILGLGVVAGFIWLINDRFISVEEEALKEGFGDAAAIWFTQVRRWV